MTRKSLSKVLILTDKCFEVLTSFRYSVNMTFKKKNALF